MVKDSLKIQNIVATTSLQKDVPLTKLAKTLPNTEYNPEQFPGLVLRVKKPKSIVKISYKKYMSKYTWSNYLCRHYFKH